MPSKGQRQPIGARLARYTDRSSKSPCWIWTGAIDRDGYGVIGIRGDDGLKHKKAHRVSYEFHVRPLADHEIMDHLCRVRNCVNPDHLEPVTTAENVYRGISASAVNRRRTKCRRGHEFTPENTYVPPSGRRVCRTCSRAKNDLYRREGRRDSARDLQLRLVRHHLRKALRLRSIGDTAECLWGWGPKHGTQGHLCHEPFGHVGLCFDRTWSCDHRVDRPADWDSRNLVATDR